MDGVLIIDKPAGLTSFDVVARVRRILDERRVGHTGTLDPFATGVLVVLVGSATRLAQFLSGAEKEYEAVIRLGYATDTGDVTGEPIPVDQSHTKKLNPQSLRKEDIESAMATLRGKILQTPPMYSAKKVGGRKLYELARRGEEIERQAVPITVSEFEALPVSGSLFRWNEDGTCDFSVRVVCSAGTYVRALAQSLGERLGVGAHLAELRRTRAGEFRIEDAGTLEELAEILAASDHGSSLAEIVLSPDDALSHLPFIDLTDSQVRRTCHGVDLRLNEVKPDWLDGQQVRLRYQSGALAAIAIYDRALNRLHAKVVIAVGD